MTLLYNGIIRALNSIYLQAPYVLLNDHNDFIAYCQCWVRMVNSYHRGEEVALFPDIEKALGAVGKGIMDINLKQHGTPSITYSSTSIHTTKPLSICDSTFSSRAHCMSV